MSNIFISQLQPANIGRTHDFNPTIIVIRIIVINATLSSNTRDIFHAFFLKGNYSGYADLTSARKEARATIKTAKSSENRRLR